MPLALGFDYGLARIGVATGQTLTQTASPLKAIKANDGIPNWDEVESLLNEWQPDIVIIGLPLNEDNSTSDMARRAQKFGQRIHGRFGFQVEYVNEYYSTIEARECLNYNGKASGQDGKLDAVAASLILERWLGGHHA